MKNIFIITVLVLFSSCNIGKDSTVFNSDKLKGKYKVDLTPFIAEATKNDSNDDSWAELGKGIAALALSSVQIEMSFYDNQKGVIYMDGGLINFANALSENSIEKAHEFKYKVEQDSVLYIKNKEDKEFNKWAIVKKFSDSYDYVQLLIFEEDKETYYFNLKRIAE